MTEEEIKSGGALPKDHKVPREWLGVTLEDIDSQWAKSKDVHPSIGQQLAHIAAGIDRTLKERNHH